MQLAIGWFALCVAALCLSGVLAVLLVLSRTPGLAPFFPFANFFHTVLVAHVDLSVLVWFIAAAGALWSLNSTPRLVGLGWVALVFAIAGTMLIAIAPFGGGTPIMSNYVPVLENDVFLYGLLVVGAGFALLTLRSFLAPAPMSLQLDGADALRFGLKAAAVAAAVALMAMAWSLAEVPRELAASEYYELLFWGPGHVIQFCWTLLMLVAWAWLATLANCLEIDLDRAVEEKYGRGCPGCHHVPCRCDQAEKP